MKRITSLALATLLAAAPAAAQVTLNGAGATFPNIIYQNWMLTYNQAHPDAKLNYRSSARRWRRSPPCRQRTDGCRRPTRSTDSSASHLGAPGCTAASNSDK